MTGSAHRNRILSLIPRDVTRKKANSLMKICSAAPTAYGCESQTAKEKLDCATTLHPLQVHAYSGQLSLPNHGVLIVQPMTNVVHRAQMCERPRTLETRSNAMLKTSMNRNRKTQSTS